MLASTAATAEAPPPARPPASPAAAAPSAGPDQLTEVYRAWTISCRSAEGGGRTCAMEQSVVDSASRQTLLRLVIAPGEGAPAATFLAPFGLDLARGIVVDIDGGETVTVPFKSCFQFGCVAPLALDGKRREAMRTGGEIRARLTPADDPSKTLDLKLSLAGFTAALKRLDELR